MFSKSSPIRQKPCEQKWQTRRCREEIGISWFSPNFHSFFSLVPSTVSNQLPLKSFIHRCIQCHSKKKKKKEKLKKKNHNKNENKETERKTFRKWMSYIIYLQLSSCKMLIKWLLPTSCFNLLLVSTVTRYHSAWFTYLCMFSRYQCTQCCKYSCASLYYCCLARSRDKKVAKRCTRQRLVK